MKLEAMESSLKGGRLTAAQAGYMELDGAVKDADCQKVFIKNGVSSELGCCNEFERQSASVKQFKCGKCKYLN